MHSRYRIQYRLKKTAVLLAALLGMMNVSRAVDRAQAAPPKPAVEALTTLPTPAGGIQPQAVVDSKGVAHILYFQGEASSGDLYYVRFAPGAKGYTPPVRVNSEAKSAGAIGTVRTAQLAIGQGDRVHVVWNGLGPKGANGYPTTYQAYARLNEAGTAFEPQRNVMTWAKGLDGGGSVAADRAGHVYVMWHALAGAKDEAGRAVFVARSTDNGKTFAREKQANPEPTGACGCCGMKAFVDSKGVLYALYRSAVGGVNRDTMLLVSRDEGETFRATRLARWNINACPMSTYALAENAGRVFAAWETQGHIFYGEIDPVTLTVARIRSVAGEGQKHPFLTAGKNGQTLLVWTEGTGWQRGGNLAMQIITDYEPGGPDKIANVVPVWGLAAAYARPDGTFVVIH